MDRENGMGAGRCRKFIRRFRPRRDDEMPRPKMLSGAEMPVDMSGKHRKGQEKTSREGFTAKRSRQTKHEYTLTAELD